MTTQRLTSFGWVMVLTLSIVWGGSFIFARVAVLEIPPLSLVFLRVAIAAIILNAILFLRPTNHVHTGAMWKNFTIMGIVNNIIPFGLIFYGQLEIGAGLAAIVNAMTPIWTVLFAHFYTDDEKISTLKGIGVSLGFVGVAVLIGGEAMSGLSGSLLGQLSILAATISYGVAAVFGRRFAKVPAIESARGQLTMSSLLIIPLVLIIDQPWQLSLPAGAAIASTLALAIVCTAWAYLLFFKILAEAGALNVMIVTFLIPPSAIIMGILILGESLDGHHILGMAVIMAGLIVIDGRLLKRKTPQES